jgi:hypothetical protein
MSQALRREYFLRPDWAYGLLRPVVLSEACGFASARIVLSMSNKAKAIRTEVRKRAPRRRTGLVIAGALVVFLTFVVKEEIRDELKDLRDSLAAAESLYTIEQDIRIVELHTFTLEEQASTIEIRQRSAAGDPATLRYPREIKTTIAMMRERDALLKRDSERVSGLADRVSNKAPLKSPLAKMGDTISKFHEATESKVKELEAAPQDAATLALAQLDVGYLLIADAPVLVAGGDLLEAIRRQEEGLETIYGWCSRLAFLLYVFGWALSLYGSLSGHGVSGEEK